MFKKCKRKGFFLISLIITFDLVLIIFISLIFIQNKFNSNNKHQLKSSLLKEIESVGILSNNISNSISPNIITNKYNEYDWKIIIPKIKVNAPIIEGTSKEVLRKAVGHFNTTGIKSGNICLAAHNRGYKYNFFQEIKKLENNDEILYIVNNKKMEFQVISNSIIKETDLSVLENTTKTSLTLITCEENKSEYRRCIKAEEIL